MKSADLQGKRVAIMGLGREGRAARNVAYANNAAQVIAIDDNAGEAFRAWQQDFPETAAFMSDDFVAQNQPIDVLIKSPGISKLHPLIQALQKQGVFITGSTQLWLADHAAQTVAVTGSKGKSTTASLIHHLMVKLIDADAGFGGNIGIPMFEVAPAERYVVELGSYQSSEVLDSPATTVLTSLFPEHLDWHGSEAEYYRDKLNLAAHGARRIIVNARDQRLMTALDTYYPELVLERCAQGEGVELVPVNGEEYFSFRGQSLFPASTLQLVGVHNRWNAALALTWLSGEMDIVQERDRVQAALATFEPLDHRLTSYLSGGLNFVDDTLSTSPYATIAALDSFPEQPVTLLLGGQDRGVDYSPLIDRLKQDEAFVQAIIWLPGSSGRLQALIAGSVDVATRTSTSMLDAVQAAREVSAPDSIVLLSPAAPSFGYFVDYRDRAEQFVSAVLETDQAEENDPANSDFDPDEINLF